jgi:hypothetical protein
MSRHAAMYITLVGTLLASSFLGSAQDVAAIKVGTTQNAADEAQAQAAREALAKRDLASIGNVTVHLVGDSFVFDKGSEVTARYRFPSDRTLTSLVPGQPIQLPPNVEMFLVEFTWPQGEGPEVCKPASKNDSQYTCNKPNPASQKGQSGSNQTTGATKSDAIGMNDHVCCIVVVFDRELHVDTAQTLIPAFTLTEASMLVSESLLTSVLSPLNPSYAVNGVDLIELAKRYRQKARGANLFEIDAATYEVRSGWASVIDYYFQRFPGTNSCRPYQPDTIPDVLTARRPNYHPFDKELGTDNGIIPFPPKVYDVYTLRQMLAQTASQLSSVSGFNAATITSALTNLQGVTSSSSFLNAQATTSATPGSVATVNNPNTLSVTTTPATGASTVAVQATCPAGFTPTVTATNSLTCISTTVAGATGAIFTTTTTPAGNGTGNASAGAQTVVTANPLTQQTVTTNPSLTANVPTAPAANGFAAPTNIGLNASDLLTEQVQLNAQVTSLQLALQGALSDQFLIKGGKTIGTRQQTTVGINISLDPPQRYKHAVAEVKIWVFPARQGDEISVVNLLPAAKTYNVAKVTSKQNQFGAVECPAFFEPVALIETGIQGANDGTTEEAYA